MSSRPSGGFTLVEILVVIAVVAILASIVSPMVFRNVSDAKQAAARTQIEIFGAALDAYRLDHGAYPNTDQGLQALREAPLDSVAVTRWRGPYVRKEIPSDPWGNEYVYVSPGVANPTGYDLQTYGLDGVEGGEGEAADLTSWR